MPKATSRTKHNGHSTRTKSRASGQVVHFEFSDIAARKVCIAGTFNHWKPEMGQMVRLDGGKWAKDLRLKPGAYEYRLVVDGHWKPDPNADHTVLNSFGEKNSLVVVSR